jgi:hypothetical protein
MKLLSRRLLKTEHGNIAHWCPACSQLHIFTITGPNPWTWNGKADEPTLNPSMKAEYWLGLEQKVTCHYFLHAGKIRFCADSTHAMANQVVDLPDIPPEWLPDPA